MNEIYWITRLNGIHTICIVLLAVGIVTTFISILAVCIALYEEERRPFIKMLKWSIPMLILGALGVVFIPTKEEALAIYGIGGTIDYIKSNDKAKQLPDKVVDALDKYIDSLNDKDKEG